MSYRKAWKMKRKMLRVIDEQLKAGKAFGSYVLGDLSEGDLKKVREFISSFHVEMRWPEGSSPEGL